MKKVFIIIISVILIVFCSSYLFAQTREIIAYFPEWGAGQHQYYVKNIETTGSADKLTAIIYSFVVPVPDSAGKILPQFIDAFAAYQQIYSTEMSIDGIADDSTASLRGHFNQLRKLKARHPHLKILLAIGGWAGSTYFSDAALTAESRQIFVQYCIDRFIQGNLPAENNAGGPGIAARIFDGFDIDWEYPLGGGADGNHYNQADDINLSALLAEFRASLDAINPNLLLTEASPASDIRSKNFRIHNDQQYLNWFNLMTYDFHGPWDGNAAHHTNLLSSPDDPSPDSKFSMDRAVKLYRDIYGVPPAKIVPGAAFYGHGWKVKNSVKDGLYQPGKPVPEADEAQYFNLISLLERGYTLFWDDHALAAWLYNPTEKIFWTFDETQSLALKRRYVDAYNLRGIMFWEISGDDAQGTLVNTLYTGNMPGCLDIATPPPGNIPPKVSITSPKNHSRALIGANVVIKVNASDPDGSISKVEFFGDGKSLGYDTLEPYSWAWFNLPSGFHAITAVASDNAGGIATSDPVKIIVK